jgi:hypothetical protein
VICELASLARDKVATRAFVIGLWECADDFLIILLARGDSEQSLSEGKGHPANWPLGFQ